MRASTAGPPSPDQPWMPTPAMVVDHPRHGVDAPYAAHGVAHVDVVVRAVGDGLDVIQACAHGGSPVAQVGLEGRARDGAHDAVLVDPAQPPVPRVGEDDAAPRVHRHVVGAAEARLEGGTVVAAVGARSVTRHGADRPRQGVDGADALVPRVGEVDVAVGADAYARRAPQEGL